MLLEQHHSEIGATTGIVTPECVVSPQTPLAGHSPDDTHGSSASQNPSVSDDGARGLSFGETQEETAACENSGPDLSEPVTHPWHVEDRKPIGAATCIVTPECIVSPQTPLADLLPHDARPAFVSQNPSVSDDGARGPMSFDAPWDNAARESSGPDLASDANPIEAVEDRKPKRPSRAKAVKADPPGDLKKFATLAPDVPGRVEADVNQTIIVYRRFRDLERAKQRLVLRQWRSAAMSAAVTAMPGRRFTRSPTLRPRST